MGEFTGKTAIVTGGGSGIGRAVALAFRDAGAAVVAAGLPPQEPVGDGILTTPLDVTKLDVTKLDVTRDDEVAALIAGIPEIHVLVNAAGIIRRDEEFQIDVFAHVIDVNLTGAMRLCVAARAKLQASRGCIVNIASLMTFLGGPRVPAYSASKGGIAQLTRALAAAWAIDGIRVNAVAPGWIETPLTQALRDDPAQSARIVSRTPLARWGRAEEIAAPVLFLSSGAASFITGVVLPVDGGYLAT